MNEPQYLSDLYLDNRIRIWAKSSEATTLDVTKMLFNEGKDGRRERTIAALQICDGSPSAAAKLLGICERTVFRRIDDYDINHLVM